MKTEKEKKKRRKRAVVEKKDCVACGCCVKVCPKSAIHVEKGIFAVIDVEKCVGCGKCEKECPGGIITIMEIIGTSAEVMG